MQRTCRLSSCSCRISPRRARWAPQTDRELQRGTLVYPISTSNASNDFWFLLQMEHRNSESMGKDMMAEDDVSSLDKYHHD